MEPQAPVTPPSEPQAPAPAPQPMNQVPVAAANPGQGLGIASLICSILGVSLIGLILGIIGLKKSKEAGMGNGMALAGIILGAIGLVFGLLWFVLVILAAAADTATS